MCGLELQEILVKIPEYSQVLRFGVHFSHVVVHVKTSRCRANEIVSSHINSKLFIHKRKRGQQGKVCMWRIIVTLAVTSSGVIKLPIDLLIFLPSESLMKPCM
jgi:hypothetical protein